MLKLIIFVGGNPLVHGHRIREFKWVPDHKAFVYLGQEVEVEKFNEVYAKAMKTNADMQPRVRVVGVVTQPAQQPAPMSAPVEPEISTAVTVDVPLTTPKKQYGKRPVVEMA